MAIKKKKVVEKTVEDITPVEEVVEETVTPKKEVKEWTYDELILLPREEYLKIKSDIRSGKAKIKQ
jgi:hypothetical protein